MTLTRETSNHAWNESHVNSNIETINTSGKTKTLHHPSNNYGSTINGKSQACAVVPDSHGHVSLYMNSSLGVYPRRRPAPCFPVMVRYSG